jgi:hypothetical protein
MDGGMGGKRANIATQTMIRMKDKVVLEMTSPSRHPVEGDLHRFLLHWGIRCHNLAHRLVMLERRNRNNIGCHLPDQHRYIQTRYML